MIKLSDITVVARKIFPQDYDSHTEVVAEWVRSEKTVIHYREASPDVIVRESELARHRLVHRIYEDLVDPIEELYHMAAQSPTVNPTRCRELYDKIRAIMEARG